MKKIETEELKKVSGGGIGLALFIGACVIFAIGVIDVYIRPLKCN